MKISKRILAIRIKHMVDEHSEPSDYLGQYAQSPTSEFSIDRAHTEDCQTVNVQHQTAGETLDHVGSYVEKLAQEEQDCFGDSAELESLNEAYDIIQRIADDWDDCDCKERGGYQRGEYRYFNPSLNYVDEHGKILPDNTPEEVRKYVRQDYERMEDLHAGRWYYLGIRAEADVQYPAYGGVPPATPSIVTRAETITSMGLWGIASDSEKSYFVEVQDEELASLAVQLCELGFNKRAIATAFKSIKEVNE